MPVQWLCRLFHSGQIPGDLGKFCVWAGLSLSLFDPGFTLSHFGRGKSPFYTLSITGVSSQSVVLLLFLLHCWMFWSLGENRKTCPSTSESSNWRCCETNTPSSRIPCSPPTLSSLFNEKSQRQYLEQKHWCDTKGLNFLQVKHINTRCILTFKKRLAERLTFCILSV